jgi:hypothetical protein
VISNYSTLQTAVANWLDRTDLDDRIPEFIALAEARIRRLLRRKSVREALTLDSAEVALPATAAELRSLRLNTGTRFQDWPIKIITPEFLAEQRQRAEDTGLPIFAAVVDQTLLLVPEPDQEYTAEIIYFQALVALSASATTNATLTEAPDIYLYGALAEAEPYLEHDERVSMWQSRFETAIAELNTVRQNEEYGASLRPARLPVVLG